ncbi:hypothetical protein [Parafrankia sp. FMc2]|uniref:hypothetical protein n=1 Tax=Parafrankia sp. FMc2 TaxID=3233196 RepID=UPI0034D592A3
MTDLDRTLPSAPVLHGRFGESTWTLTADAAGVLSHHDQMELLALEERADQVGLPDALEVDRPRFRDAALAGLDAAGLDHLLGQHAGMFAAWWETHPDGSELLDEHLRQTEVDAEVTEYRATGWPAGG